MSQSTHVKSKNQKFSVVKTWAALKKAWKGYNMAKAQLDTQKMTEYTKKIKELERELGVKPETD